MSKRLEGKVVLITGGGTGIGTAITKRFVEEGAKVVITGRRKALLDEVVQSLPAGMAAVCAGDVTKLEDCRRMVAATIQFGGKIDVLVNNAGIDPAGSVADIDEKIWREVIEINLTGPFLMMKAALPEMIKAGQGSIINIASLAGTRCLPGMPAYCSSKAGLIMLTQQAALDYGPKKIRVNVVCPGATMTKMLMSGLGALAKGSGKEIDDVVEKFVGNVPLRRIAAPEEMSGICVHLASDDSSYMTGAVLMMDAGAAIVDVMGASLSSVGANWGAAAGK